MTRSYVWHDSWNRGVVRVTHVSFMSHMYHSCQNGSLTCGMTHSYVWHDSFVCVTWLMESRRGSCHTCIIYVAHVSIVSHMHLRRFAFGIEIWLFLVRLLQHTATHCNALQRTSTRCNTPQHATSHVRSDFFFAICLWSQVTRRNESCHPWSMNPVIPRDNEISGFEFA